MAKTCPIDNKSVIYLTCMECDDRVCEDSTGNKSYQANEDQ